jgi:hypothetical protein
VVLSIAVSHTILRTVRPISRNILIAPKCTLPGAIIH